MPRADIALVEKGLAESREKAKAMIMAGNVFLNDGKRVLKPGQIISEKDKDVLSAKKHCPWVSRGGTKLDYALSYFNISPKGKIGLDVGTSTGGFAQVLLHHGARYVYAVDTGRGQIAWSLRQDERIILHENTNARYLTQTHIPEAAEFISIDVSFISVEKILPSIMPLTAPEAQLVLLIKPQFEAGREHVGRGGIVRDEKIHQAVCERITDHISTYPDWKIRALCESPITGAKGNREFLLAAYKIKS